MIQLATMLAHGHPPLHPGGSGVRALRASGEEQGHTQPRACPRPPGHLEGRLAVVVAHIFVGSAEQQDPGTALLRGARRWGWCILFQGLEAGPLGSERSEFKSWLYCETQLRN